MNPANRSWNNSSEGVMVIGSRTPEGMPNRCPVCGKDIKLEPSKPTLDAPCPHCGHLLWFAGEQDVPRQRELIQPVLEIVTVRFGPLSPATQAAIEAISDPERLKA
jgi:hypothetical protein